MQKLECLIEMAVKGKCMEMLFKIIVNEISLSGIKKLELIKN